MSFLRLVARLAHPLSGCGEQLEYLKYTESQIRWLSGTKAAQEKKLRLIEEKLSVVNSRLQICEGILLYVLSNSGDTSTQLTWYLKKIQKVLRPPKDHLDSYVLSLNASALRQNVSAKSKLLVDN